MYSFLKLVVTIIDVGTEKQTWFYNDGVGEFTYGGTTYNLNCSIYSEYLGQLMCVADFTGDGLLRYGSTTKF